MCSFQLNMSAAKLQINTCHFQENISLQADHAFARQAISDEVLDYCINISSDILMF